MKTLYKGKEPCHGCGRTGEEKPRFRKDGLCSDCAERLKLGEEVADFYGMDRMHTTIPELTLCDMTWYKLKDFQPKLVNFFKAVSNFSLKFAEYKSKNPFEHYLVGEPGCGTASDQFVLPTKAFDAAKELCKEIETIANDLDREKCDMRKELMAEVEAERDKIYNEGVEHGRNLLRQLNAGEITHNDFNAKQKYCPKED